MISETTFEAEGVAEAAPWAELQESQKAVADWAHLINERERAVSDQQRASPGTTESGRARLVSHLGRHRPSP
jgi:hypothetical protein